jgi:hypothetical protein
MRRMEKDAARTGRGAGGPLSKPHTAIQFGARNSIVLLMLFEGPLQWCRLSAGGWRSHMSAQNPVGVIPASKTVRRTIEVAVLRGTL